MNERGEPKNLITKQELPEGFFPDDNSLDLESLKKLDSLINVINSGLGIGKSVIDILKDGLTGRISLIDKLSDSDKNTVYKYAQGYLLQDIQDGWLFDGIVLAKRDNNLTENIPEAKRLQEECKKIYKEGLDEMEAKGISADIVEVIKYGMSEIIREKMYKPD